MSRIRNCMYMFQHVSMVYMHPSHVKQYVSRCSIALLIRRRPISAFFFEKQLCSKVMTTLATYHWSFVNLWFYHCGHLYKHGSSRGVGIHWTHQLLWLVWVACSLSVQWKIIWVDRRLDEDQVSVWSMVLSDEDAESLLHRDNRFTALTYDVDVMR